MSKPQASPKYELNQTVPYTLHIDDDLLNVTKQKAQLARYPEELVDPADDDWNQGAKVKAVQDLADYWKDAYSWRAEEVVLPVLPCPRRY